MPSSERVLTEEVLRGQLSAEAFPLSDRCDDRVGIEMELFPLVTGALCSGAAQPTRDPFSLFPGLYPWLTDLADRHGWAVETPESEATLSVVLPNGGTITLEPGGQIEYSTPPFTTAAGALEDAERVEAILAREGESVGIMFAADGFNRWLGSDHPRLVVEKERYLIMDRHFQSVGPYGRMMMRRTCATQICLDFGTAETLDRRWRLANLIAGPLNALFANARYEFRGRSFRSFRHEIWRHADPCRSGMLEPMLRSDPVSSYLDVALDATVMFVRTVDGLRAPSRRFTFGDWVGGQLETPDAFPDLNDWRLHLTTLFPDVRPKGFLELRSVDALPARWRRAAVVLASGLLYNDALLDEGFRICAGEGSGESRVPAVTGYGATEAGTPGDSDWNRRFRLGRRLLETAVEETGDAALREYYREFASGGLTPADRGEIAGSVAL